MALSPLSTLRPAWRIVNYHGVPIYRAHAWALEDARLGGEDFTIMSGDRRKATIAAFNKKYGTHLHDQEFLWNGWKNRLPGFLPANPPDRGTHLLLGDGTVGALHAKLPKYELGIDVVSEGHDNDAGPLVDWLNRHGYSVDRPYHSSSEAHHIRFKKSPATNARARLHKRFVSAHPVVKKVAVVKLPFSNLKASDLVLQRRLKAAGARYPLRIISEARRAGIPLSWAFALVEQESGFHNIFGCDHGSILCHEKVTKARVDQLIRWVHAGHVSNGVGLTQLTSIGLILQAEKLGGAHLVGPQLRVGFSFLAGLTNGGKNMEDAWHYNGARAYQAQLHAKQQKWHKVIVG